MFKFAKIGIYICYFPFQTKEGFKYRFYFHDINKNKIVNPIIEGHYEYFNTFEEGMKETIKKVKKYIKNGC